MTVLSSDANVPLRGRATVVSRHPATIRRVAQALGAVGLGADHYLHPSAMPRGAESVRVVVVDLDVDHQASPQQLIEQTLSACANTPVVVAAGVAAKKRLISTLACPAVCHVIPKLGGWIDKPPEERTFEGPDEQDLAIALRRLLQPQAEPLGPRPYLIEGFSTIDALISSSTDKEQVLSSVLDLAQALDLSDEKKRRIEVVCEELLLNALYNAPRGPDGRALHAGIDRRTPVQLAPGMEVRLRYGCDGRNFVLSVTDRFGALDREPLVRSLSKMLTPEGPRPATGESGAGLGLMLTYGAANQLIAHVVPGRFTELTAIIHVSGSNRTALARGSALHLYFDGRS